MPKKSIKPAKPKVDPIEALRFYREAPLEALLPPVIVGVVLNKTEAALAKDRHIGEGPKFVKQGRFIYYRKRDTQDYSESLPALSCTP
jgi:hypothetical protein